MVDISAEGNLITRHNVFNTSKNFVVPQFVNQCAIANAKHYGLYQSFWLVV